MTDWKKYLCLVWKSSGCASKTQPFSGLGIRWAHSLLPLASSDGVGSRALRFLPTSRALNSRQSVSTPPSEEVSDCDESWERASIPCEKIQYEEGGDTYPQALYLGPSCSCWQLHVPLAMDPSCKEHENMGRCLHTFLFHESVSSTGEVAQPLRKCQPDPSVCSSMGEFAQI